MKIALIGPGSMPIPSKGWGGVEGLIWQYNTKLLALGHEVTIFNSKDLVEVADAINKGHFDFIHLHYDEYADFFNRHLNQPFCVTSHYGNIMKEHKWARGFFSIYADLFKVPGLIAISKEIKQKFLDHGYSGQIYSIKVGIDVNNYKFSPTGNPKAICLGKVEYRKRQAFLAKVLDGVIDLDFVGPMADPNFQTGQTTKYLGVWSNEEKLKKLTDYSCLVLFSDGEAAPMVVPEAFAAGLSVLVSRSATANLEPKEFITVLPDKTEDPRVIAEAIKKQIVSNRLYRQEIRTYAENTFDNAIIIQEYLKIIADFVEKSKRGLILGKKDNWLPTNISRTKYCLSRAWLFCSHVKLFRLIFEIVKKYIKR